VIRGKVLVIVGRKYNFVPPKQSGLFVMILLEQRLDALVALGDYLDAPDERWDAVVGAAIAANPWFTESGIRAAAAAIRREFLDREKLRAWITSYPAVSSPKNVGIVAAGNIPLVGFHDLLCVFAAGHKAVVKPSSKDERLLRFFADRLTETLPAEGADPIRFAAMLKGCDAYIATGSNNSARYFEEYFGRYPSIIRRSRTSIAVLHGDESAEELAALAGDVLDYYGLGCRNVTQVCVPRGYDFAPLLEALRAADPLMHHHKYKNNYDYHLALFLLNKVPYITNESVLLIENDLPFSGVSVLHYRYYDDAAALLAELHSSADVQAVVGRDGIPFGEAQKPRLTDYADGVDTMAFLTSL